ncbi:nucleotidyltransferase domain-containing protein [Candidatus Saccharibacteria bacterium]|nr:nucleotidyltransferase domain-containing protein [Candidatus Saccharibacteria bacterium]
MLSVNSIKEIVTKVSKRYGVKKVYLFGSYAKGLATEDSDVDLVIDKGELHGLELSAYRLDLIDEFGGTDVDVLTESSLKPKFADYIKNDRILLYGV